MTPRPTYPQGTPSVGGPAPVLETARLRLRGLQPGDFEAYAAFLATPRSIHMDGPHDRDTAWSWFCNDTAHWPLFGYGGLMIEADGELAGQVSVTHGVTFPEHELGWFLFDGFEGKGYASEAARALRDHVYSTTEIPGVVSYCSPENAGSIAVAKRLGAVYDPDAPRPDGDTCHVYRHPTREALQ
ncbi:MAG: GNAT family N-acetyltransferase [Rhodobacteraceae bacterium]|nr:GNAT family N-acetyltransferase [Paracoccaceae bacterium]